MSPAETLKQRSAFGAHDLSSSAFGLVLGIASGGSFPGKMKKEGH